MRTHTPTPPSESDHEHHWTSWSKQKCIHCGEILTPTPDSELRNKLEKVLMFDFESKDFVNDLIGKERLETTLPTNNQQKEQEDV